GPQTAVRARVSRGFKAGGPAPPGPPRGGSKEARALALLLGMPAAASGSVTTGGRVLMADVMIGVDPHKGSHTAVAIGLSEERLGELQVQACSSQAEQLLGWAAGWPERAWAVEGAAGLGHLLAQQLVAAGERVVDVPPKLAARARLLPA